MDCAFLVLRPAAFFLDFATSRVLQGPYYGPSLLGNRAPCPGAAPRSPAFPPPICCAGSHRVLLLRILGPSFPLLSWVRPLRRKDRRVLARSSIRNSGRTPTSRRESQTSSPKWGIPLWLIPFKYYYVMTVAIPAIFRDFLTTRVIFSHLGTPPLFKNGPLWPGAPRGCTVTALNSSLRPPARRVVRLARRPA